MVSDIELSWDSEVTWDIEASSDIDLAWDIKTMSDFELPRDIEAIRVSNWSCVYLRSDVDEIS